MAHSISRLISVAHALYFFAVAPQCYADLLCVKKTVQSSKAGRVSLGSSLIVAKETTCPRGFKPVFDIGVLKGTDGAVGTQGPAGPAGPVGPVGPQGLAGPVGPKGETGAQGVQGPAGPKGADGVDGSIRIYGDGSFGSYTATVSGMLTEPLRQYQDFKVNPQVTLQVPSGTVIRCKGSFSNLGVIQVLSDSSGGSFDSLSTVLTVPSSSSPGDGIVASHASAGEYGSNSVMLYGGRGGRPFGELYLKGLLKLSVFGGASGGAGLNATGGAGGGTLTVLAAGPVVNSGTIVANGSNGSAGAGGGGGGVIILASKTSVDQSGQLEVQGGAGGSSKINAAAGGGGGGGVAHLLAPVLLVQGGTLRNDGGRAGATVTVVTASIRSAGGGGGAGVGGSGGFGWSVGRALDSNLQDGGTAGSAGPSLLLTQTDPTSLF
jgi:hypothetical protein